MTTNYIDKLAFIDIKDQKVLVTKTKGKDTWYIPGGKREQGETDIQALTREVKEELSVDLIVETIKHYGTFEAQAHGKPKGVIVRMTCYTGDFEDQIQASSEIETYEYFEYSKKELTSQVDFLIFDDLKKKELIK